MKPTIKFHRGLTALNTAIGACLLASASINIAVAASPTNTFTGVKAGVSITTGTHNSAFGTTALQFDKIGRFNTAVGYAALRNTTGESNVGVGFQALFKNTSGGFNVAIGDGALKNNLTGTSNIGLGEDAGFFVTGNNNVCIANPGVAGENRAIRIGTGGTHLATILAGVIMGDGSGLANIGAGSLASNSVTTTKIAAGAVSSTKLDVNLTLGGTTAGTFSGDGALLTNLNASNLASGTVADGRLSSNVALRAGGNTFTGNQAVAGTVSATNYIANFGTAGTVGYGFESDDNTGIFSPSLNSNIVCIATVGSERVRVDSSGNVGIGTTAPNARLAVESSSASAGNNTAQFSAPNIGGNISHIHFGTNGDWFIRSAANAGKVVLQDNGGNVAIGTVSTGDLTVTGDGNVAQGVVVIDRNLDDGTLMRFRRAGTTVGTIDVAGGVVSYNAFTGSHFARTDETIERGMLVSLTGKNGRLEDRPGSEILYGVTKTRRANDPAIMGSYLARQNPSASDLGQSTNPHLIMAVGNGEMWVIDTGRDLAAGEYLMSSEVAGHAMTDPQTFEKSYIVGRVAEPIDWKKVTTTVTEPDGREHKRALVSVFYETFVIDRTHSLAKDAEVARLTAELAALKAGDQAREARLTRLENALVNVPVHARAVNTVLNLK